MNLYNILKHIKEKQLQCFLNQDRVRSIGFADRGGLVATIYLLDDFDDVMNINEGIDYEVSIKDNRISFTHGGYDHDLDVFTATPYCDFEEVTK